MNLRRLTVGCRKSSQRTIDELRANVAELETRLRNETSRIKSRYETEHHEMEMQIDVLSRNNGELSKNNKGLLAKVKVCKTEIPAKVYFIADVVYYRC